jgi:hypothetical protein
VGFMQYTRIVDCSDTRVITVDCSDTRVDQRKLEPLILRRYRTKQRAIKQNSDYLCGGLLQDESLRFLESLLHNYCTQQIGISTFHVSTTNARADFGQDCARLLRKARFTVPV